MMYLVGFPGGSVVKNLPVNAGDVGLTPGSGKIPWRSLATYSSILPWKIPWVEESGALKSIGSERVGQD